MIPLKDNQDVASFLVTKHSWKGKYKRVFSIGTHGITTYNPDRLEVTNKWLYADVITVASAKHSNSTANHDFTLVMKKEKKIDSMKFSSEHKCLILTEAFKYRHLFAEKPKDIFRFQAYKHHWSGTRLPVVLEVGPCALDQLDPSTHTLLASYPYCDIQGILQVRDVPGGFVLAVGGYSRLHLFSNAMEHQMVINKMLEMANLMLSISIKVLSTTITLDDYHDQRFGKFSGDQHQTSLSEFLVHKVNPARHMEPMRRTLCLSDTCILERDPQTYSVVCLRPLSDVFALIRDPDHPQRFSIEYLNGQTRTYLAGERDALLASLLDGVRAGGQRDVHVRCCVSVRGLRLGPRLLSVGEDTEASLLRLFQNPVGMSRAEVIERFNANVGYSGLIYSVSQDRLFAENKEKLITGALSALISSAPAGSNLSPRELEAQFHALRRLCASKVGFAAFTALPGFREWIGLAVVSALRRGSPACSHAALDVVCALMQPMHQDPDLRQEQLNKASMLSSAPFLEGLLSMWADHVSSGSGALVVAAMLDFLTFALCVPYSETTDGKQFDQLLEMVSNKGRILFKLFEHPSMAINKGAGLVMRALIEEGSSTVGPRMQALALAEAALPRHLLSALFAPARQHQRHLARHLVALWLVEHAPAHALLRRIMPSGLLAFLESTEAPPAEALAEQREEQRDNLQLVQATVKQRAPHWEALERQVRYYEKHIEHYAALALQHWAQRMGRNSNSGPGGGAAAAAIRERPVVLRRRRERIKSTANWPLFYYQFHRDHALPNLIWNHTTREELRNALENELRAFTSDREAAGGILTSWNHAELEVQYQCLQNEVKIGDYYLRILLEQKDSDDSPIRKSYEFFNDLYHRFLSTPKVEMKCMCLQAMTIVYGRYYEDIGPFADTKYIVQMLDRTCDRMERDRFVQFLAKLILHRRNVSEILEWNGIRILVELMTLAHLHTSRATVPTQSNVIEGPAQSADSKGVDREWYYNVEQGDKVQRVGPVSFQQLKDLYKSGEINNKTKCWANSMEGWRAVGSVPQLKWTLAARGTAVMDESALAATVLDLLITCARYYPSRDEEEAVIRPLPKIKRLISEPACLAHVVQLLLTFDPILVEKVATLLYEVMQDNPEISKLYLTGVFYFMLLYTGSNLLPIARFLRLTHMKQAFRADQSTSDIMQRSILGQLLPEAMVCYLENHGAEKFAQIFLGEWDTPEAIWSSEMRRLLMMKVAAHIGEFTPRLRAHIAARYPYLAIPAVRYPQLQHELFCNMFYLRHLCDTLRFPDWPIPHPVDLLKDVLEAWRKEVEKKPPSMTVNEAYSALGLAGSGPHDEAAVRKAYYRLAQQFHPDKNPEGRDRFEAVNQAYEFLCSRNVWTGDGPNANNIVLILRTQTILFQRYSEVLAPYKYAGYPQLLRTARLEAEAEALFAAQSAALLPPAVELALATVRCSKLNAEELRREGGLQVLHEALSRCVPMVSASALSAAVCAHAARCFAVAAAFPACRAVCARLPLLAADLVPLLRKPDLGDTACAGAEAVAALAADPTCRSSLARAGAIHALLPPILQYDYTLTESGVDTENKTNKQEVANQLAKQCVSALAALYGPHDSPSANDAHITHALHTLLTQHLCATLCDDDHHELLKTITSNWRTPYLVWDNSTRGELRELLRNIKLDVTEDGPLIPEFHYTAHENLVPVGGVYIDICNDQPDFPIKNPQQFILDLLKYLQTETQCDMTNDRVHHLTLALTAVANVIIKNPGVEIQCIGQFGLIFGLLSARAHPPLQDAALRTVLAVAGSRECVEDIAASGVLGHLLALLGLRPPKAEALAALAALLANTALVKEALAKGAVIYLLDLFCNSKLSEIREAAAELMARMMADKLHGPKVQLTISRYVPAVFAEAMRAAGAAGALHMFERQHEHPELVWTDAARAAFAHRIAALRDSHQSNQLRDANATFEDREALERAASGANEEAWAPPGEVVVAGVYLKLYLQTPHWNLRSPKRFLQELLTETFNSLNKDSSEGSRGDVCARALAVLLRSKPALGEACAQLGELPRLARLLVSSPRHAVPVLTALADTQACVVALSQTEVMSGVKCAIKSCRGVVGGACEALAAIFSSAANTDRLVLQALECDLIGELLSLLETRLDGQTAAHLVRALKAMSRSVPHGDRVKAALAKSAIWDQYAAQKHDLFITAAPQHALTGVPQSAGYLTAPVSDIPAQPPPID
ncbi:dnaJ homolog subfamily C member 13 isoform X2 [Plodia interpunctella]|uniref:dnaJ homolog subfamily C member 13 isoform X2 n=1 Tax=Plodia interpunctella TaxID=58824 RepID=UPI002367F580|nr:dnaJ homolog subfamily C member 13 isoform X2 [Plodia interpunctella]